MLASKQSLKAFLDEYGLAVSIVVLGHIIIFGSLLFGVVEFKKEPEKFKIPEYTAINLMDFKPPVSPNKPESKKTDEKKSEPKKPIEKKPDPVKPKDDKKKIEDQKKRDKAKKISDQKRKDADLKKLEDEKKKKLEQEKQRLENLKKLKEEQEAREWAELNDESAQINDELIQGQKILEEELQRESDQQAAYDALTERQKELVARRQEQMNIVATFGAVIKAEVESNWNKLQASRPYEAEVRIKLAGTGEVEDVKIIRSNGDKAFDQSLLNAVRSTSNYKVPEDLIIFEENFRTLNITFRGNL
ncbi:MAG: TonB C-terminal domain-containing protein [Saccharospirillaceae bacterium]|nr:TonB C-terminal domain-containing protein [Pseudomonadales bacterium]NRB78545.1 TonB C-terminal domain-containing protein [Saccharospirillaceae bacterium]